MSDWRNLIAIVVVIALLTTVATLAFSQHADEIRCEERGSVPARIGRLGGVLCLEPGAIRK